MASINVLIKNQTILFCLVLILVESTSGIPLGCSRIDHATCDDVCKTDGFWYGHCQGWDGVNFQCKCFDYKPPLNSSICANYRNYCQEYCMTKSKTNGYCFPAQDLKDPRGVPQCQCFKELPQEFML